MAPRTEQHSEREISQDINAAIAGTEDEIFQEAMGEDELDNDGDTDLEEMGEGLEGEHLEDEDDAEEDAGPDPEEEDEEESDEEGEEYDAQAREGEQPRDEPRIPPGRLRAEADRARQAEQREQEWQRRHEILEARFNDMQARINTPQPQRVDPPPLKPDMFSEPEKYEQWVLDRAEERSLRRMQAAFDQRDEAQRQAFNDNVERSMASAEHGPRGFEFRAAYNALLQLNPRDPQHRSTVQSIVHSRDPAEALFGWWDENGGEDFRQKLIDQLQGRDSGRGDRRGRRNDERRDRDDRADRYEERPRHVVRPGRPMRSLNGAAGGSAHRVADPEMLNGSEGSVFDFATRR
jgi:hypothetical protein